MSTIKLTDAARYYGPEDHQTKAWQWLQEQISGELLDEFGTRYRDKPETPARDNPMYPIISKTGIALIKEFEGVVLRAYQCPAQIWTIGIGHTSAAGAPQVVPGMTITEDQAEQILASDLGQYEDGVNSCIEVDLNQDEFDALVSFAFNCGVGALAESTLRRRLNANEDKPTVFKEELPRWTSGGMPGLIRRRDAEVKLATTGQFP